MRENICYRWATSQFTQIGERSQMTSRSCYWSKKKNAYYCRNSDVVLCSRFSKIQKDLSRSRLDFSKNCLWSLNVSQIVCCWSHVLLLTDGRVSVNDLFKQQQWINCAEIWISVNFPSFFSDCLLGWEIGKAFCCFYLT